MSCLFVLFAPSQRKERKNPSVKPWHCTHQPPLATEPRLLQARAASKCSCCGLFVCPSVRLSIRPFVVVLFVLLFLAEFWVLQSVGPYFIFSAHTARLITGAQHSQNYVKRVEKCICTMLQTTGEGMYPIFVSILTFLTRF